jgi:hypothetical protein
MKAAKIILINLIVFAILLAVLNWACGIYLKNKDAQLNRHELPNYVNDRQHAKEVFDDYNRVKHQYEPFTGWKCLPYRGETLTISGNGERVTNSEKRATKSIHFFGGSTMWGEGSDDSHTIPALFQSKNSQFAVFNHGQLAYNSRQELDALITLYSQNVHPDLVVFYDGVNDAAFLCPKEIKQLPAHRLVPMYREKLYAGKTAFVKDILIKMFIENTLKVASKMSGEKTTQASAYDCISNPDKAEQIAEMMIKNWEMANEIVSNHGGKFFAILQPAAFVGNPKVDHIRLDDDLGQNFKAVYQKIQGKISERKHPWIYDLSNKFDRNETIFIDFCHVSPNGNEIIANEVTSIIAKDSSPIVSNLNY